MHDVSMSGASGHGEEPMASMHDAQGEFAARQIYLPNIRDDRKSVDRHKQIGLRYGSRCQPVRAPPDDKPRTAFLCVRDFGVRPRKVPVFAAENRELAPAVYLTKDANFGSWIAPDCATFRITSRTAYDNAS
jgi:hypothetical protein